MVDARDKFATGLLEAEYGPFLEVLRSVATDELPTYCRQTIAECTARMRELGPSRLNMPFSPSWRLSGARAEIPSQGGAEGA